MVNKGVFIVLWSTKIMWAIWLFLLDCTVKVNLGFVLDASRTTFGMFDEMQFLVKQVAEGFDLKPGGTQASVVT